MQQQPNGSRSTIRMSTRICPIRALARALRGDTTGTDRCSPNCGIYLDGRCSINIIAEALKGMKINEGRYISMRHLYDTDEGRKSEGS